MSGIWDFVSDAFCKQVPQAGRNNLKDDGLVHVAAHSSQIRPTMAPVHAAHAYEPARPTARSNYENLMPNLLQEVGRSSTMGEWFGLGGYVSQDNGGNSTASGTGRPDPDEEAKARAYKSLAQEAWKSRQLQQRAALPSRRSSRPEKGSRKVSKDSAISKDSQLDELDTTIGKGFSAKMRAGVEQAEKATKRTEMVPQKDGGFVATIQKGFEGLFGHLASSKEEVLKMRGPMPALEYEAVPGDDVDQKVQYLARWLPEKLGKDLRIFRVSKGQYEIGGEKVELKWHSWTRPDGVVCREVFVLRAVDVDDGIGTFEPLPLYLQHSAGVSHNLKNGHAVTHVPDHMRMSFHDAKGVSLLQADSEARFNAMAVAAEQAKLREKAALEWQSRKEDELPSDSGTQDRRNSDASHLSEDRGNGSKESSQSPSKPPPAAPQAGSQASGSCQAPLEQPLLQPQLPFKPAPLELPAPRPFGFGSVALPVARTPMVPMPPPQLPMMQPGPQPRPGGLAPPAGLYGPQIGSQHGTFYGSQQGTFYGSQAGTFFGAAPGTPVLRVR